jgi:hypothetical protein
MTGIPHDIWLYIADFIPNGCLEDLLTLNSSFFNLAMTARYRKVTLPVRGETVGEITRMLLRLQ